MIVSTCGLPHSHPQGLPAKRAFATIINTQNAVLHYNIRDHFLHKANSVSAMRLTEQCSQIFHERRQPTEWQHISATPAEAHLYNTLEIVQIDWFLAPQRQS